MTTPMPMHYAVAAVPGRIVAALDFIRHIHLIRTGAAQVPAGDAWKGEPRELTEAEEATYEIALGSIADYFAEEEITEPVPVPSVEPGPEGPGQPAPSSNSTLN